MLWQAIFLQIGYNASLVTLGASFLGVAAGVTGTFLFLRKRALISDAVSHATLPGIGLAFIVMVLLGGDGRNLPGLLLGSAISAGLGLLCVDWLSRQTRLAEDAAIGAVLSVFFGFGIVLLTVIQSLNAGRQAGLESFLLGATAGMLWNEAVLIAVGGALTLLCVLTMRRPMTLISFDPDYAASTGMDTARVDLAIMALAMAVTVIGLKIVGLILVVAMLIIPPVTARFWTDRSDRVIFISGLVGGLAAYFGAALSAVLPDLPTGPIIVLISFSGFILSMLLAPNRGVLAAALRYRRFQKRVHMRQGLLALAQGQPIYEGYTMRLLKRAGLVQADGVATDEGRARAGKALRDETRWQLLRADQAMEGAAALYDGLRDIETVLTADQISELDKQIDMPKGVTP